MELSPEMKEAIVNFLHEHLTIETEAETEGSSVYFTVRIKLDDDLISSSSSSIYCNGNNY